MAFHTNSFFVGVATVLSTMVVGFVGGVMMTDAFVGQKTDRQPTRMEQRLAEGKSAPSPVVTDFLTPAPIEQKPVPALVVEAPPVQASAPIAPPVVQPAVVKVDESTERRVRAEERRKIERKRMAERHKQDLKRAEELHRVAQRVRQIDVDDREGEPPMVRSYASQSPFSFMD